MKTRPFNQSAGLTLIEVAVVVAMLMILAFLLLPPRPHRPAYKIACANDLKQIGVAFKVWSQDHGDAFPMEASLTNGGTREFVATGVVSPHFQVMSNELNTPKILVCPTDKTKNAALSFASGFSAANISYFVGVDASTALPQSLLAGDANITLGETPLPSGLVTLAPIEKAVFPDTWHQKQGNILLADGSVQGVSSSGLRNLLQGSGLKTNRVAMP